ncbi:acyltransferase family protein [Microbacterium sp. NPDC087591]|uniref:acyltransferase family protein n=1 Tax=Microbacterium sp. NPDC087591 TaxID=3364192 RepID=UPI0037FA02EB
MSHAGRVDWVDVAKGIAIFLVVFYHAVVIGVPEGLGAPIWADVNAAVSWVRMPLFFFAAGLFAEPVIRRPWAAVWSGRVGVLVWVFLLWTVLRFAYFSLAPMETRPAETDVFALILSPVRPTTGLWFLHALIVFLVLAKLMRRVPAWIQLAGATLLSALFFSTLTTGSLSYNGMARYFVFFLAGLYLRERVLIGNARPRPFLTFAVGAGYAGLMLLSAHSGFLRVPGIATWLGALGVVFGCMAAVLIANTPLRRPLAYVGRSTLPIYVTHVVLIAVLYRLVTRLSSDSENEILGFALPVLTVFLVVPLTLLLAQAVRGVPVLRYLYAAPPFVIGTRTAYASRARRADEE